MGFIQRIKKRLPPTPALPSFDDLSREKRPIIPRFAFFRRRIRLKGNSSISVPLGLVLLFPCLVIVLILLLFVRHPSSPGGILIPAGAPPSIRFVVNLLLDIMGLPLHFHKVLIIGVITRKISEQHDKVFATGCLNVDPSGPRANAAFVVLTRNKELDGVIQSIKSIERHFNRWFHYPYVFLNDGDFDKEFKDTVVNYTSGPVEFGQIDSSMWGFPEWIDPEVAREGIRKQGDAAIMYGGMESYHHMCRFYSG
jgi:mannosyltransferase